MTTVQINELTYGELVRKQADINKLFPAFDNRVKAVAGHGGVNLHSWRRDLLRFKVTSGTKEGVKYDVYVKFPNLEQVVIDKVKDKRLWKKDKSGVDLRKLAVETMYGADVMVYCSCLIGSTGVCMANGSVMTLEDIDTTYGSSPFKVFALNDEGNMVSAKAYSLGVTNRVDKTVVVTLDNGTRVESTIDHLYMLDNNEYVTAQDLEAGAMLRSATLGVEPRYVVSVDFKIYDDGVDVYDLSVPGHDNFLTEAGVYVHNCPADLYWGGHYIRTQRKAKYTKPERRPPVVRNPRERGAYCKHLDLVMDVLPAYASTLAKLLSKFYGQTIKYAELQVKKPGELDKVRKAAKDAEKVAKKKEKKTRDIEKDALKKKDEQPDEEDIGTDDDNKNTDTKGV